MGYLQQSAVDGGSRRNMCALIEEGFLVVLTFCMYRIRLVRHGYGLHYRGHNTDQKLRNRRGGSGGGELLQILLLLPSPPPSGNPEL